MLAGAAVVALPLGGWETTVSAADTVQSSTIGEAHAVGPFSVTVGKAGWFNNLTDLDFVDPKKEYLVMRVTITEISAKSALPPELIGDVLKIYPGGSNPHFACR